MTDEEAYKELIEKVRGVDEEAAEYLETDARRLRTFAADGYLAAVMSFNQTPQGHDYWADIAVNIGQWPVEC